MEEDQKRQKGRIRLMEAADLDAVAKIWLNANRQAHDFIPAAYWEENFATVKEMLPSAEVYVWEETSGARNPGSQIEDSKAELQGFIGLNGENIEQKSRCGNKARQNTAAAGIAKLNAKRQTAGNLTRRFAKSAMSIPTKTQ